MPPPAPATPILRAAHQQLHGQTPAPTPQVSGHTHSQRGRRFLRPAAPGAPPAPPRASTSSGMMRSFVDSFVSPFVQCWQPPLNACVGMNTPTAPHYSHDDEYYYTSNYASCGDVATCAGVPACGSNSTRRNRHSSVDSTSHTSTTSRANPPTQTPLTSTARGTCRPVLVTPMANANAGLTVTPGSNGYPVHATTTTTREDFSPYPTSSTPYRIPPQQQHAYHPHFQPQQEQPAPPPLTCDAGRQTNTNTTTTVNRFLTDITCPTSVDVLCGRGGSSNRHNVHFRELVAANKAVYSTLTKKQKMLLSRQVVDTIHHAGGRFLSKDPITGRWNDIGLARSLEKASQTLREKTTNNHNYNDEAFTVVATDTEVEATAIATADMMMEASENVNPVTGTSKRTCNVEAPPLVIPKDLEGIYRPRPTTATSSEETPVAVEDNNYDNSSWVAEFPEEPEWVADFSSVDPSFSRPEQRHPNNNMHPMAYHPSGRSQSMPALHRGAFPFSAPQSSRFYREQSARTAPMISPLSLSTTPMHYPDHPQPHHHSMSWYPQSPTPPYTPAAVATPNSRCWEEGQYYHNYHHQQQYHPHHHQRYPYRAPPSPEYDSSAASYNSHSTVTNAPPEMHQYSQDFPFDYRQGPETATQQHPQPNRDHSPELKRQRTHDDEHDNKCKTRADKATIASREERQEDVAAAAQKAEDVILFDCPDKKAFSLQDTSLTEGSQQLPAEVESKLSLQEKVISPSGILQTSGSLRPRNAATTARRSSEKEGMGGLAALSAAAFLRLDEGA